MFYPPFAAQKMLTNCQQSKATVGSLRGELVWVERRASRSIEASLTKRGGDLGGREGRWGCSRLQASPQLQEISLQAFYASKYSWPHICTLLAKYILAICWGKGLHYAYLGLILNTHTCVSQYSIGEKEQICVEVMKNRISSYIWCIQLLDSVHPVWCCFARQNSRALGGEVFSFSSVIGRLKKAIIEKNACSQKWKPRVHLLCLKLVNHTLL